MKACFCFLLFVISFCNAQNPYPQNYFSSPLDITLVLSGTFAELRTNHFHSGLDIKTQGKEGFKTYASAEGYVSRIKISRYGYGKALYITHPNGYTTSMHIFKSFLQVLKHTLNNNSTQKKRLNWNYFRKPKRSK